MRVFDLDGFLSQQIQYVGTNEHGQQVIIMTNSATTAQQDWFFFHDFAEANLMIFGASFTRHD